MNDHIWYYYKDSIWGEVLKGPTIEVIFIQLIRESKISRKTKVMSPTRTQNNWTTANELAAVKEVLDEVEEEITEKKRAKKRVERASKQQIAQTDSDYGFSGFVSTVQQIPSRIESILASDTNRKEKLHSLRTLEKEIRQTKREINSSMQLIRSRADYDEANAGVLVDTLFTLFGKSGQGSSYRASSRRSVRTDKENAIRPWQKLKCHVEEFLVLLTKTKHMVSEVEDSAFRQEVPDSFNELVDPEEAEVRDQLVEDFEDLAFDVLCCMMACDRKITPDERRAVIAEMLKIGSRFNEKELAEQISEFISRAKDNGLRSARNSVLERVQRMSEMGCPLTIILEGVVSVAKADGSVSGEEREFCRAIDSALSSPLKARYS